MSRYSSRDAVVEVIKGSIVNDSACTGLPRDPALYNIAGIVRDAFHYGGDGWSASLDAEVFTGALRRHLRPPKRTVEGKAARLTVPRTPLPERPMITRTATSVDRDTVEFIRLGFHCCSLDFTAPTRNWETFTAAMAAAHSYNEFSGAAITASFRDLFDMASTVEVGRDGSACLYVTLPFWTHQRHDSATRCMGQKYTAEERQAMAQAVIDWARTVKADIVRVWQRSPSDPKGVVWRTGDEPYRIRVWWD